MSEKIGSIGKKAIEFLGIVILACMLLCYVYNTACHATVDTANLLVVVSIIFFMLVAYGVANVMKESKPGMIIWIILTISIPRLIILYFVGELYPISDAKTYFELTSILVQNGIAAVQDIQFSEYMAMFPFIIFYPLVLSKFIGIIGISIGNMQLINLLLNVFTGLLLYGLVKERAEQKQKFAIIAVLLWACNPSQFLYTPMLYTEHLFALFVVGILYVYSKYEKKKTLSKKQIITYGVAMGILLFGMYQSRVAGLIIGIAIILYEILCVLMKKKNWKESWKVFIIAIFLFIIGNKLYQACIVQKLLLPEHQNQPGFSVFTFYIGSNPDYAGKWNEADASQMLEEVRKKGITEAQAEYWKKLWTQRYQIDLWEYLKLQVTKAIVFHNPSHNVLEYMQVYQEISAIQKFALATYLFETAMIVFLFVKLVRKKQFTSCSGLFLLIIIGNTMFNMFVESSARYSYINAIILLLLLLEQWNEDYLRLPKVEKKKEQKQKGM